MQQLNIFHISSFEILDVSMGHRGMQKEIRKVFGIDGNILSVDIRGEMTNGMKPDIVADSQCLPFCNDRFKFVLFDPPFSFHGGKSCGTGDYNRFYVTYGLNIYTSRLELGEYIDKTFREIWRVLSSTGTCIFKWSESRIKLDFPLSFSAGFYIDRKWKRPSKYKGTKTGTNTWYLWLKKHNQSFKKDAAKDRHTS
jgi:hypothetical protein